MYQAKIDQLRVQVYASNEELGRAAARIAAHVLEDAIRSKGHANLVLATGNSQLTFLAALRDLPIDWSSVNIFHMDEYIGLQPHHPARFDRFLRKHLLDYITPKAFYPVLPHDVDAPQACQDYEALLRRYPIDLCVLGIGENGHLAFNDPPYADFADPAWVKIVRLDEASRRQQVGEGHFASLAVVPIEAVTLTIPALLVAKRILAVVPENRKAEIVYRCMSESITPALPASILRRANHATLYLDEDSARIMLEKGLL